jgi:hypothetical protein
MIRQKILSAACLVAGIVLIAAVYVAPLIVKGYENDQS